MRFKSPAAALTDRYLLQSAGCHDAADDLTVSKRTGAGVYDLEARRLRSSAELWRSVAVPMCGRAFVDVGHLRV